jgi:hypothetical protein
MYAPWPCCETISTPEPIEGSSSEVVPPVDWVSCLIEYIGPSAPPWSNDPVDTVEDIFLSDYSWCSNGQLGPIKLDGSTSCETFASIRRCEANYLIERCGEAKEHQYIPGDPLERGSYAKCDNGNNGIDCWPISHWTCPDCPICNSLDPSFIGCLTDTETNQTRIGSDKCKFTGRLNGTTPCSVFAEIKECLRQECIQNCGSACIDNYTGFYILCDNDGVPGCVPHGSWVCNGCQVDRKTGCGVGTGVFNPSHIDIPLSVMGNTGNPSALTVRIPLSLTSSTNHNQFGDGSIRVPSGINELAPPDAPYQILNINGQPPYTTGFEIKNINVSLDNLTGKININFEGGLFYCQTGYLRNNNIYLCPPQPFNGGSSNNCLDCSNTNIVRA